MRFYSSRNTIIASIAFVFWGIIGVVMCLVANMGSEVAAIILYVFFAVIAIIGIVLLVISQRQYVVIDNQMIKLYSGKRQTKCITFANVQQLIICQIFVYGNKNQYIVFDDGSFFNKKINKKKLMDKKTLIEESWILIDYSNKRLQQIQQVLPDCKVRILTPDEY